MKTINLNKRLFLFLLGVQVCCYFGVAKADDAGGSEVPPAEEQSKETPRSGLIGKTIGKVLSFAIEVEWMKSAFAYLLDKTGAWLDEACDEEGGKVDELCDRIADGFRGGGNVLRSPSKNPEPLPTDGVTNVKTDDAKEEGGSEL